MLATNQSSVVYPYPPPFEYDDKYVIKHTIPERTLYYNTSKYNTTEYLEYVKNELIQKAFLKVAEKSLSEEGVNIKTIIHTWNDYSEFDPMLVIAVAVLISYPKRQIYTIEPSFSYWEELVENCIWCGSRNPKDDQFHSGTCENCGGPKIKYRRRQE